MIRSASALLLLLVSAGGVAPPASRNFGEVCYVATIAPQPPSSDFEYLALPRFDHALGQLVEVRADLALSGWFAAFGENCDTNAQQSFFYGNGPSSGGALQRAHVSVGLTGLPQADATLPPAFVGSVPTYDGAMDYSGPSSWHVDPIPFYAATHAVWHGQQAQAFVGTGSIQPAVLRSFDVRYEHLGGWCDMPGVSHHEEFPVGATLVLTYRFRLP